MGAGLRVWFTFLTVRFKKPKIEIVGQDNFHVRFMLVYADLNTKVQVVQ